MCVNDVEQFSRGHGMGTGVTAGGNKAGADSNPRSGRVPLDGLVERLLAMSPFQYRVAADDSEREIAYRLRGSVVVANGWRSAVELDDGMERDSYDERAVHILGWDGSMPVATGRIVLPPNLPTEAACELVIEPVGHVADVGRMCVAPTHQGREHAAFVGLMCRLYQEVRIQGYEVACGMMSAPARTLVRLFGLHLEVLGPEQVHWNEPRTPVRFSLTTNADAASHLAEPLSESGSGKDQ